jgi:hypothetical protein
MAQACEYKDHVALDQSRTYPMNPPRKRQTLYLVAGNFMGRLQKPQLG